MANIIIVIAAFVLFIFFSGIRIVRPTHRGLVERLGKYTGSPSLDLTGLSRSSKDVPGQYHRAVWWMPSRRRSSPTIT